MAIKQLPAPDNMPPLYMENMMSNEKIPIIVDALELTAVRAKYMAVNTVAIMPMFISNLLLIMLGISCVKFGYFVIY